MNNIDTLVSRFLSWRLPENFSPDGGIEFTLPLRANNPAAHWPSGTNLLNAHQAKAMLQHVLADLLPVWQPMRSAPKDGTAILVLVEHSDIPRAVRWLTFDDDRATAGTGWYMTWDDYKLTDADGPRCWMRCPAEPDA